MPAAGSGVLLLPKTSTDFLFHLAHPQFPFSSIVGKRHLSIAGEQQNGIFMLVHPSILSSRLLSNHSSFCVCRQGYVAEILNTMEKTGIVCDGTTFLPYEAVSIWSPDHDVFRLVHD